MTAPNIPAPSVRDRSENKTETAKKRGRPAGSQAKPIAELPAEMFRTRKVEPSKRGLVRRVRVERSAQQKALDNQVLVWYQEWVDAGRPSDWLKMPVREWPLDAQYLDDALRMFRKATSLHGKKLHLGDIREETDENTHRKIKVIPFCVRDRKIDEESDEAGDENPPEIAS